MPMLTTVTTTLPFTTPTLTGPEFPLPSHPPPVSDVVARGPPMPRLRLTLTTVISATDTAILMLPTALDITVLESLDTPDLPPATLPDLSRVLARGPLMPSPRLRPMLTTDTTDTAMDTVMVLVTVQLTTVMDTPMVMLVTDITIK